MLTALSISWLLATRSVNILWRPQIGSVYQYKWRATSEDYPGPDGVTTLAQEESDQDTVKELRPDGDVLMERKVTGVKAKLGSSSVPSKVDGDVITQSLLMSSRGVLLHRTTDAKEDVENPRFDLVERLVYPDKPVSVGDSWTYKESGSPVMGTYDNETVYTFRGSERVQGILAKKIQVEYRETSTLLSINSTGAIWVSPEDGSIVKKDLQVSNLTVGSGARMFNLRIRVDRVEPKVSGTPSRTSSPSRP